MSDKSDGEVNECVNGTERWTVNRLIQYAKTLDRAREYQDPQDRIRKRKLAFDARKWARFKEGRHE